jgi:endonuclease/exonuclease/phosphatase family metal-dependent hydrolase
MTKIMTLNLANYDDHGNWDKQLDIIAQVIVDKDPDIISLQEVRFNPTRWSTKCLYQNMGEQVLFKLNDACHAHMGSAVFWQPTMFYKSMLGEAPYRYYPLPEVEEWEGKSIISRLPVFETGSRFPNQCGKADLNRRSTQHVVIALPDGTHLYVYNCHFYYDGSTFSSNLAETIDYIKPSVDNPCCTPQRRVVVPSVVGA